MLRALTGFLATVLCVVSRAPLTGRWLGFEFMGTVSAEFRRAIAAERRYDELRRKDAAGLALEGIAGAEIPRRVFEEFYSLTSTERTESAPDDGRRVRHRQLWRRSDQQPQTA
jgi:predicted N-acyltransferase